MNNRFKFRICHESNGHKTIIYPPTNTFMIGLDGKVYENYKKRNDHGAIDNLWEEVFDADNVIIQQFTGLTDKNGKEVYEGDIVKVCRSYGYGWLSKGSVAEVSFDEKELCYFLRGKFRLTSKKVVEVIGSIYENPELLKEVI